MQAGKDVPSSPAARRASAAATALLLAAPRLPGRGRRRLHRRSHAAFLPSADVSREPSVRACVRAVVQRFGRLDALVNNAGITGPDDGPVEKLALAGAGTGASASTSPARS